MEKIKILAISLMLGLISLNSAYAGQSNFSIAPPPIASSDFEAGKKEGKLTAIYIGMKGTGFEMTGGGANFISRKAITDSIAFDGSAGVMLMMGTMDLSGSQSDLSVMVLPLSFNMEYQPVKGLILYGGVPLMFMYSTFKYDSTYSYCSQYTTIYGYTYCSAYDTISDPTTVSTTSILSGLQGGAQYGINAGNFKISPFIMFQSLSGSATTETEPILGSSSSSSMSIPSYTQTSYGLDMLYVPWNITLSSLLQEAAKSGENEAIKTTIIQLSWNF